MFAILSTIQVEPPNEVVKHFALLAALPHAKMSNSRYKNGLLAQLAEQLTQNTSEFLRLLSNFLASRRECLSPHIIEFHYELLNRAKQEVYAPFG